VPRWAFVVIAAVVLVLVASQLLVPGIAERQTEDRLEAGGGRATVSLSAFPALRLLFDDGSRFQARASGLDVDLNQRVDVLDRLDGFAEVDVLIDDLVAGPLEVSSFQLTRDGSDPYRLVSSAQASPAALVDLGADALGLPGGDLFGGLAREALGKTPVPIELDMELVSSDDGIEVASGGGTVAGIPTGPIGELITAAIVSRL
jgi:DNA-binding transcriptional LysR family regulator